MSGKIEISRELAKEISSVFTGLEKLGFRPECAERMRALLATPVVERQDAIGTLRRVGQVIVFDVIGDPHIKDGMEVFTSAPAPVAVPVEIHQMLVEMRQQFERANFVALGKLLTACLEKVKELNS